MIDNNSGLIDIIPPEFITSEQKNNKIPISIAGRLIFIYNCEKKFYILPCSENSAAFLRRILNNTTVPLSSITKTLTNIKAARNNSLKNDIVVHNEAYKQSIRILWAIVILFLIFFLMIALKIYYFPNLKLEIIAIICCAVGFTLNLIIILANGKIKIEIFTKTKNFSGPDSYFRHEIFVILNESNRNLIFYGLE